MKDAIVMSILDRIVERKREIVDAAQKAHPRSELEARIRARSDHRAFAGRLSAPGPSSANIIAEIKRASPSKGPIRPELDPAALARAYEAGGAACLSVLTDGPFFMGSADDLVQARAACALPVLRKEFIISSYQVVESAAMGADAVLLIVRILSPAQLQSYLALCRALSLDALVEIHTEADLETALASGAHLIGINNRNLNSFETNTKTAIRMAARLSADQVAVAASGIQTREDILENTRSGIWNFLIGESLVRAQDPSRFLRMLQGQEEMS
jgi:indole-3-glycerol phosphate synthase